MIQVLPTNYHIVDTVGEMQSGLVRGPRPNFNDVQFLKQFKYVINLEVGWFEFFTGHVETERNTLAALNINYVHSPMSDFFAPTPTFLLKTTARIISYLQYGNVLVHCLHGEDRTGMVCAAWRIGFDRWTPDAAINEMLNMGFHKIPYCYWIKSLRGL